MSDSHDAPITYKNPVISGFYPDPSICRVGDNYYIIHSSFEYFPGVPIFHSKDLVHWRQIGYCLTRQSQLNLDGVRSSGGIYAPTIRYHQGTFYMITTLVGGGGNFYVTAADPAGPWSDPVWLDKEGIDPSLFFDDDGTVYYLRQVGGQNGYAGLTTIDLNTGKLAGGLKEIWRGTGDIWPEGPHLYKIKGTYYLMIAEGGTGYGHQVTIARAENPFGPYVACPDNPILTHRGQLHHPFQALGHADMVETEDGWWAVCLGIRPQSGFHYIGRETFLVPVTWTKEGWPLMGINRGIEPEMRAPRLKQTVWPEEPTRVDFSDKELGLQWNYIRNPREVNYSLTERPGYLRLKGSAASIDDVSSPTFVCRRQTGLDCRIAVRLSFNPKKENEEAGMALRGDEKNHYVFGLTYAQGERQVFFRMKQRNRVEQAKYFTAPGTDDVILGLNATSLRYSFFYQLSKGKETEAGRDHLKNFALETAGGFTGVVVGMYATGNGNPCTVPADFNWFEYEEK